LRALFLMLLLANLLFLAWATWIAPPAPLAGMATPSAPDRRAIRLLREAPAQGAAAQPASAASAAAADQQQAACVSAGPFLERAQAEVAASQLQKLGFTSRLRAATEQIRVGQWVRVPNLATAEDAANALAALKAAGVADAEIVHEDPPANTVSLGVFGEPARAAQVAEIARKAGFSPEVSDRTRSADVFWLDVDRRENGSLPGLDAVGPKAAESAPPLELRACPASPAPAG
jgi:hypothetical protein